jgi:very-short-patch-repair endonuclease
MAPNQAEPKQTARARELRRQSTIPERRLWRELKKLEIGSTHFRRQVPIGPFVADFACHAKCLVIELDGGHHFEHNKAEVDKLRTAWLQSQGYLVLRFTNTDVIHNLEGVLTRIEESLLLTPTPSPSPQGGGEGGLLDGLGPDDTQNQTVGAHP